MHICSCSFFFIAVFFNISCTPIIVCIIVINFYFLYIMGWNKVLLLLLLLLLVSGPTVIGHSCCSVPSLPMLFPFVCLFVFFGKTNKKKEKKLLEFRSLKIWFPVFWGLNLEQKSMFLIQENTCTVNSLLTDTSIRRTPL